MIPFIEIIAAVGMSRSLETADIHSGVRSRQRSLRCILVFGYYWILGRGMPRPYNDNDVEMVGHNHIPIDRDAGIMQSAFFNCPAKILAYFGMQYFSVEYFSEKVNSFVGAYCDEIYATPIVVPFSARISSECYFTHFVY